MVIFRNLIHRAAVRARRLKKKYVEVSPDWEKQTQAAQTLTCSIAIFTLALWWGVAIYWPDMLLPPGEKAIGLTEWKLVFRCRGGPWPQTRSRLVNSCVALQHSLLQGQTSSTRLKVDRRLRGGIQTTLWTFTSRDQLSTNGNCRLLLVHLSQVCDDMCWRRKKDKRWPRKLSKWK